MSIYMLKKAYILISDDHNDSPRIEGVYDDKNLAQKEFRKYLRNYWTKDHPEKDDSGRSFEECVQEMAYGFDRDYLHVEQRTINETNDKEYQRELYEAYQLHWMLSHGYSIKELVKSLDQYAWDGGEDYINVGDEGEGHINVEAAYYDWEEDAGFQESIWACFDEFLNSEFLMRDDINQLIDMMPIHRREKVRDWYYEYVKNNPNMEWK